MRQEKLADDVIEIAAQTDNTTDTRRPNQAYKAGFWLVATVLLTILVAFLLEEWVHREQFRQAMSFPLLILVVAGTTYKWANSLVRRSGLEPSKAVGLMAGFFFSLSIFGTLVFGYDLIFVNMMKILNITQTEGGTRPEFYVVFVMWTGIVTGVTGLGVGIALKQPKLALKLLIGGLVCGAVVFFLVAVIMEQMGFKVGTARADGIPSMPIVTVLGICSAALAGSELFGRILVREGK